MSGFAWEPKGTVRARAFPLAVELVNRGHEVAIFLTPYDNPADSNQSRKMEGVRIVNVNVGKNPSELHVPLIIKRLIGSINEYAPDLVHVFKPKGYAGAACTWLLIRGYRSLVLDCDDWEGWGGWNEVKTYPWIVKEYIDRQEKWLMRSTPVVTTASRALESRAVKIRESSKNVFYIPNCGPSRENVMAQDDALSMTQDEAKKYFGLPDAPVIFYSGQFETDDDAMLFCRAAARAAARFRATIIFVGEGPNLSQVKGFISQQSDVKARFFPRLPYDEFVRLVAASDVAAFPYPDNRVYQSKCSARIIDYMTMGKAVVTTAVGQNCDYIVDGESGILAPPGDESRFAQELETLLQDKEFRMRLGGKARQRIKEKFSWAGEPVENCLVAYRQLLCKP